MEEWLGVVHKQRHLKISKFWLLPFLFITFFDKFLTPFLTILWRVFDEVLTSFLMSFLTNFLTNFWQIFWQIFWHLNFYPLQALGLVYLRSCFKINLPPIRALKASGHVIFKLRYNQIYQLKTTYYETLWVASYSSKGQMHYKFQEIKIIRKHDESKEFIKLMFRNWKSIHCTCAIINPLLIANYSWQRNRMF